MYILGTESLEILSCGSLETDTLDNNNNFILGKHTPTTKISFFTQSGYA